MAAQLEVLHTLLRQSLVVLLPIPFVRVSPFSFTQQQSVVEVVYCIASVHDCLPTTLQPQAHWPEGLQQRISCQTHKRVDLPALPFAIFLHAVTWRWQIEGQRLLCVPALSEIEGHAIIGLAHKASILCFCVHRDASCFQDTSAIILQLV